MKVTKLIDMQELCETRHTTRMSVHRWIKQGMPAVRQPNGRFMFRESDIDEWSDDLHGKGNQNELRTSVFFLIEHLRTTHVVTKSQYERLLVRSDAGQDLKGMADNIKTILEGE